MQQLKQRNIAILFFTLVIDMLGFGMIIPIFPTYITSFGASGRTLGLLVAIYGLAQFIFSPIWGDLSDRYGRKPFLLLGTLGNALAQLLLGLANSLWMLFVARALAGVLASAALPTAMAYVSDSTDTEDRSSGMGLIGAAMGVGMILGPGLGGWLADIALPLPFLVAAVSSLPALALIVLLLPESLPESQRNIEKQRVRGPQFKRMWNALFGPIGFLLVLALMMSFAMTNFESVFGMYALERYGYGPKRVGIILMVIGVISALMQGLATGALTKHWGEVRLIRILLVGGALAFLLLTTPQGFWGLLLASSFFILTNAMLRPAISSLTSRRAESGQGVAMGLSNSFMSLGRIFGPIWAGFAFDFRMNLPYLTGALLTSAAWIASLIWLTHQEAESGREGGMAGAELAPQPD